MWMPARASVPPFLRHCRAAGTSVTGRGEDDRTVGLIGHPLDRLTGPFRPHPQGKPAMSLTPRDHEHAAATVQGNLDDHVRRGAEAEDRQRPAARKLASRQGPVADDPRTEQGGGLDIRGTPSGIS